MALYVTNFVPCSVIIYTPRLPNWEDLEFNKRRALEDDTGKYAILTDTALSTRMVPSTKQCTAEAIFISAIKHYSATGQLKKKEEYVYILIFHLTCLLNCYYNLQKLHII